MVLSLLYGDTTSFSSFRSYGYGSYHRDPTQVTITLILAGIFFGIFWVGGSRRIIIRAKTAKIVVEASVFSLASFSSTVGDSRIFSFANRIQSLIVKPHDLQKIDSPDPYLGTASPASAAKNGSSTGCSSCGAALVPGSRFCEGCGIPVS
jgi:hypothetical protein